MDDMFMFYFVLVCVQLRQQMLRRRVSRLQMLLQVTATASQLYAMATRPPHEPVIKSRHWWDVIVPQMGALRYRRNFRIPRAVMERIVDVARSAPEFRPGPTNAERFLPVDLQVACAVWRLGRPVSVYDCMERFGISTGSVINASYRTYTVIEREFKRDELTGRLPQSTDDLARNSELFYHLGSLRNVALTVDGTLVPIQRPATEEGRGGIFFTRKGFHGLNFQTVVDPKGHFVFVSGGRPGNVWDGNVYVDSDFYTGYARQLPEGTVILADSGYVACTKTITPFKKPRGGVLDEQQLRFNTLHALARNIVEKAIGRLKTRFRWMLRGVEMGSPQECADRFIVCCILHNMCIEHDDVAGDEIGLAEGDQEYRSSVASKESEEQRLQLENAIKEYERGQLARLTTDPQALAVQDLDDSEEGYVGVDTAAAATDPSRLPTSQDAQMARQRLISHAIKDGHIKLDATGNAALNRQRADEKAAHGAHKRGRGLSPGRGPASAPGAKRGRR